MKRLATLIRSQQAFIDSLIRGPKKKGQVQAKIESNDIINIYKDKPDPQPRDIKEYPIFVQEMSLGMFSIHEWTDATFHGIKHSTPTIPTYKSFLRGVKRQRFKSMREYKQLDLLPIDKNEKTDVHDRTSLYDLFNKTKEELEEEKKAAEAAEALEDDDEDQI